jgi:L-fuculose-phosphate aldolase
MHTQEFLRADLVRFSQAVHAKGWVANHDGNLTCRYAEGQLLSTPTAVSKGAVAPEMLIVVSDQDGSVLQGTRKAFSELKLHLAAYRARPDIGAVIHAHPPQATGFAVCQQPLDPSIMAETIVSLGPRIPLVPFGLPGETQLDEELSQALSQADVVMLGNHGVLAVGPDLETCMLRIELLEHLAKITLVARQLGGAVSLPPETVQKLSDKHASIFPRDGVAQVSGTPAASGDAQSIVAQALRRLGN